MSRKRRVFGSSFKAQVALAAVRGDKTTSELAGKFQVHPSQVMTWKKQLLEQAAELFEDGRRKDQEPPDQVWSSDITYIPMRRGFFYLTAVIDWYSRYVLAWRLSNTLDGSFCHEALDEALACGRPEIFNTDQGAQFTAAAFTSRLQARGIAISMDGRGRALDNVFIERLWRTVKYEEVYRKEYADGWEAEASLSSYFRFYCHERGHQSLDYRTPGEVYGACDSSPQGD